MTTQTVTKTVQLVLPNLHSRQAQIKREASRFNVLACGRRFGKDILGHEMAVDALLDGMPVAWFAPTYRMMLDTFKDMRSILAPISTSVNASDHRIEIVTGGVMDFWSLDGETVRGRRYKRVIINEAAMVSDLLRKWNEAVRPTLADFSGDAWFLSTPRGHDGFWQMHQLGVAGKPDWRAWQFGTSANPHIKSSEVDAMRVGMPERSYLQEIEAQFLADGSFFPNVDVVCVAQPAERVASHVYVAGVDWARASGGDYTVFAVMDATTKSMVHLRRINGADFESQKAKLKAMVAQYQIRDVLAEYNAMGGPLVEALQRDGLPVRGFTTTAATKHEIISALELAMDQKAITLLNDEVLKGELSAYEKIERAGGLPAYSAPDGLHDDTVIATALAWHAVSASEAEAGFAMNYMR